MREKSFYSTITFKLIAINFIILILEFVFPPIIRILGLTPSEAIQNLMIWQFFTYMFTHAGFWHFFMNMFVLIMFGPRIEYEMGSKKFLIYYIICGLCSAVLHITLSFSFPQFISPEDPSKAMITIMMGASGAVFGVLTAYALRFPRHIVFSLFGPMPAIVFIIFYALFELLLGFGIINLPGEENIAHFGHLGGILAGFILVKFLGFQRKRVRYFWE